MQSDHGNSALLARSPQPKEDLHLSMTMHIPQNYKDITFKYFFKQELGIFHEG